jgi:hypothetical protein
MIHRDGNVTEKIVILKTALDKADAIIIGAGAGLSAAAGLAYDNADTFNTLFPGYHDRYDLQTINEADFYRFPHQRNNTPTGSGILPPYVMTTHQGNPTSIYTVSFKTKIMPSLPPISMVSF